MSLPTMSGGRTGRRKVTVQRQPSQPSGGSLVGYVVVAIIFVLVIAVLLFGRKLGLPSDLVSVLLEARPAKLKDSDWRTVSPAGARFTVEMPGDPLLDESVTGADDGRITTRTLSVQVGADQVFLVQYADLRGSIKGVDDAAFLDQCRESAVQSMQGKLVSERDVFLERAPGREFLVQGSDRAMRARMYLKDTVFYSQQIVSPKGRVTSPAAERFFASFAFRSRSVAGAPGWKEFSDPAGRFSVLLPGEPAASEDDMFTRAGHVTLYRFTLPYGDNHEEYSVQYMDYPEDIMKGKSAEQLLKDAGTVDAYNMNGTLVREQALSIEQYAGREVQVEAAAVSMRIRLYLVDRRLYKIVAMWPKSRSFSPNDERFLASFRLTS